jgi:hypothetical protein
MTSRTAAIRALQNDAADNQRHQELLDVHH